MGYNMADDSNADAQGSLPGGEKADPATVFAALAEIIYQGSDANEMYAAICVAATLIVPGCDHASLLVKQNDRYITVGASDRMAARVDDFERRAAAHSTSPRTVPSPGPRPWSSRSLWKSASMARPSR